jgi:hypothetical protein
VAGPLSKLDSTVAKLARRCLDESAALIPLLEKLKVPLRSDGTKSRRGAARAVFKTMLKNGDLERGHKTIVSLERQLATLLLYAIKMSLLQGFEELRDSVERNGRDCVTVVRDSHSLMVEKLTALQLDVQTVGQDVGRVEQGVGRVEQGVGRVEQGVGRAEEGVSRAEKSIGRVEQRQLNDIEQKRVEDLLQSLAYNGMDSRRDMIVDPVGSSYNWAFEDDKTATKQWLDTTVEHCWISGEPGTGKSVFTKSFRLDRRTITALQTRTGNANLLVLDHYFWIAGDSHQRSLRAMLQHLCFQALQQYGTLAKIAFPDEWASRMQIHGMSWTTKTLVAALKRIIVASGFQTCIIIDGLDECEDKERSELIRVLLDFTKATRARLCVSSRPWSDFEKAFDNWPRLRLPENNAWDIFQLICRRLEQANDFTFRDCVDNVRLFDITCAERDRNLRWTDKHESDRQALNPSHRLIHDLCVKTDGNLLWVTCVLETVSRRVADGQSLAEVVGYIVDLPRDLEDYYHDLVYTRIHSTYRTGKVSECAMALKIVTCVLDRYGFQESRFKLIWALQISISTGIGIAHDPEFFAQPSSSEAPQALNQTTYQSVSAFVQSRCKDLMVTSMQGKKGHLSYQHRVVHDFLFSERLQSSLDVALPEHFRRPQFTFHVGLFSARKANERAHYAARVFAKSDQDFFFDTDSEAAAKVILYDHLRQYLSELQGPLDQRAAQTCDEITTTIVQLDAAMVNDENFLIGLMLHLVQIQRFTSMSEIIRLGSQRSLDYIELAYAKKEGLPAGQLLQVGKKPSPIRHVVSTSEQHARVVDSTPGQAGPHYLPCLKTWWTAFLIKATSIELEDDVGPVWSRSRAAMYVARAFLEAGASIEVEICVALHDCHGHICACPDPSTHSKLYECPESTDSWGIKHTHAWVSAKDILSDYLGIPEAEVLQTVERNRNTQSKSIVDLLELARDTEAAWQHYAGACVRSKILALDRRGQYSKIIEAKGQVDRSAN